MFDRGIAQLLESLPQIAELDEVAVRRMLSGAFFDVVEARDLNGGVDVGSRATQLRRLATAIELHAVLAGDLSEETVRACAFVAAEALEVHRELAAQLEDDLSFYGGMDTRVYAAAEAAALYFVAGYDANAAVASRALAIDGLDPSLPEAAAIEFGIRALRSFFELRRRPRGRQVLAEPPEELPLDAQVRWELWRRLARSLDNHVLWLRQGDVQEDSAASGLRDLTRRLEETDLHADIHHLAALLELAVGATAARALRAVPPPAGRSEIWDRYVSNRVAGRPLLWPAAQEFARVALPGVTQHAVVSVPTGAGKSEVAELAIAQTLAEGWALYLAPTNALVAQLLRDLENRFSDAPDVSVRAFLGGGEFTEDEGETLDDVVGPQILVMTPEKCSLALRRAPEAFRAMRLLVFDECHLLGEPGGRGVVAELVIAELLHRASETKTLLLSALVENAEELAAWLEAATGGEATAIEPPWRPTRTVRALLGIEPEGARAAFDEAAAFLEENPKRRTRAFEAPVVLLANLQGAWRSTDADDYGVIETDLTAPLVARRQPRGSISPDPTGYVNEMSGRLTRALAATGHRVLTFLPASKHYSFSVARDMPALETRERRNARPEAVSALLALADYELGVPSALRDLIDKGTAVHTSAMLRDEQRASELAFEGGQASALFATGTLAQGLNLPATAVIIGGTRVGHDPDVPQRIRDERDRAQLLNAIGRGGRAYVASRSLSIVIPDQWVVVRPGATASRARDRAPFLEFEDASTQVRSNTESIIEQALTGAGLALDQMSVSEQTAFSFLSMANPEDGAEVVRRSFGAFRIGISIDPDRAARVESAVRAAGSAFTDAAGAPQWVAAASNAAGLALPAAAALHAAITPRLDDDPPHTLEEWLRALANGLRDIGPPLAQLTLPRYTFASTSAAELFDDEAPRGARNRAAEGLVAIALSWMQGAPLTNVASEALGAPAAGNAARTTGSPLPKIINIVENGLGFGLARAAGALAAFAAVAEEHEPDSPWSLDDADARELLSLLPLAIRFGCDGVSTAAWYRWGFRRRRVAHLLARLLPPPDGLRGEELAGWVRGARSTVLEDEAFAETLAEEDRQVIDSLRTLEA